MGFLMFTKSLLIVLVVAMGGCAGIKIMQPMRTGMYDWVMYGGSPQRDNVSKRSVQPPLKLLWEYNALAGISGTPVVRDSLVLVGTLHGELQAIHLATGKRLGYVVLESSIAGTPVLDGTNAIAACAAGNETVVSYSLREGRKNWSMRYGAIESDPLLFEDHLFVTTLDGLAYCLKKLDGMEVWKFESGVEGKRKPIRSSPATDGSLIVFGGDDGMIYAVDRSTGSLRWMVKTDASIFTAPVIANGRVLVGNIGGRIYCLALTDGALLWKKDAGAPIYAAAAATSDRFFLGASDGTLKAYDAATGVERWSFTTRGALSSAPLISENVLYFGSLDRTLYAVNVDTGEELWRYSAPGRIRVSPVIWNDVLLVTSEDKYVLAFKPQGGEPEVR